MPPPVASFSQRIVAIPELRLEDAVRAEASELLIRSFVPNFLITELELLFATTPHVIYTPFFTKPHSRSFPCVCLWVDLVNFTSYTGQRAAEHHQQQQQQQKTRSSSDATDGVPKDLDDVTRFAGAIVNKVYTWGGDVVEISGSYLLCAFQAEDSHDHGTAAAAASSASSSSLSAAYGRACETALQCAWDLRSIAPPHPALSLRVGVSGGLLSTGLLGGFGSMWRFVVAGPGKHAAAATLRPTPLPPPKKTVSVGNTLALLVLASAPASAPASASESAPVELAKEGAAVGGTAAAATGTGTGGVVMISQEVFDSLQDRLAGTASSNSSCTPIHTHSHVNTEAAGSATPPFTIDVDAAGGAGGPYSVTHFKSSRVRRALHRTHTSDAEMVGEIFGFVARPVVLASMVDGFEGISGVDDLTVLAVCLDGYAPLTHDADLRGLQGHLFALQQIVAEVGGYVSQFTPDARGCLMLIALWGIPIAAYKNNVERALGAGMRARALLGEMGTSSSVAVASGPCYYGCLGSEYRREYVAVGGAVDLAGALAAEGKGDLLLDEDTYLRLSDAAARGFRRLSEMRLRGRSEGCEPYGLVLTGGAMDDRLVANALDRVALGRTHVVPKACLEVLSGCVRSLHALSKGARVASSLGKAAELSTHSRPTHRMGAGAGADGGAGGRDGREGHDVRVGGGASRTMGLVVLEGGHGCGKEEAAHWLRRSCLTRSVRVVSVRPGVRERMTPYRTLAALFRLLVREENFDDPVRQRLVVETLLRETYPHDVATRERVAFPVMCEALGVTCSVRFGRLGAPSRGGDHAGEASPRHGQGDGVRQAVAVKRHTWGLSSMMRHRGPRGASGRAGSVRAGSGKKEGGAVASSRVGGAHEGATVRGRASTATTAARSGDGGGVGSGGGGTAGGGGGGGGGGARSGTGAVTIRRPSDHAATPTTKALALRDLFRMLLREQPMVVCLEDAHLMDERSWEVVLSLSDVDAPSVLLLTHELTTALEDLEDTPPPTVHATRAGMGTGLPLTSALTSAMHDGTFVRVSWAGTLACLRALRKKCAATDHLILDEVAPSDVQTRLAGVLGVPINSVDPHLTSRLHKVCRGEPFWLEEVLVSILEHGLAEVLLELDREPAPQRASVTPGVAAVLSSLSIAGAGGGDGGMGGRSTPKSWKSRQSTGNAVKDLLGGWTSAGAMDATAAGLRRTGNVTDLRANNNPEGAAGANSGSHSGGTGGDRKSSGLFSLTNIVRRMTLFNPRSNDAHSLLDEEATRARSVHLGASENAALSEPRVQSPRQQSLGARGITGPGSGPGPGASGEVGRAGGGPGPGPGAASTGTLGALSITLAARMGPCPETVSRRWGKPMHRQRQQQREQQQREQHSSEQNSTMRRQGSLFFPRLNAMESMPPTVGMVHPHRGAGGGGGGRGAGGGESGTRRGGGIDFDEMSLVVWRFMRLSLDEQVVLRLAAVVGMHFRVDALDRVTPAPMRPFLPTLLHGLVHSYWLAHHPCTSTGTNTSSGTGAGATTGAGAGAGGGGVGGGTCASSSGSGGGSSGLDYYSFRHPTVRSAVYDLTPPNLRGSTHLTVAEHLENYCARLLEAAEKHPEERADLSTDFLCTAFHYSLSGMPAWKATEFLCKACDEVVSLPYASTVSVEAAVRLVHWASLLAKTIPEVCVVLALVEKCREVMAEVWPHQRTRKSSKKAPSVASVPSQRPRSRETNRPAHPPQVAARALTAGSGAGVGTSVGTGPGPGPGPGPVPVPGADSGAGPGADASSDRDRDLVGVGCLPWLCGTASIAPLDPAQSEESNSKHAVFQATSSDKLPQPPTALAAMSIFVASRFSTRFSTKDRPNMRPSPVPLPGQGRPLPSIAEQSFMPRNVIAHYSRKLSEGIRRDLSVSVAGSLAGSAKADRAPPSLSESSAILLMDSEKRLLKVRRRLVKERDARPLRGLSSGLSGHLVLRKVSMGLNFGFLSGRGLGAGTGAGTEGAGPSGAGDPSAAMTNVVPSRQGTMANNHHNPNPNPNPNHTHANGNVSANSSATSNPAGKSIQSHRSRDLLHAIGLGATVAPSANAVEDQQGRLLAKDLEEAEPWQRPLIEFLYEVAYQARNGGRRRVNSSSNGQSHGSSGNGNSGKNKGNSGKNIGSPRNSVHMSRRGAPPPPLAGNGVPTPNANANV